MALYPLSSCPSLDGAGQKRSWYAESSWNRAEGNSDGFILRNIFWFSLLMARSLGLGMAAILQKPLARQLQELYGTADQGGLKIFATLLAALLAEGIILLSIRHSLKKTDKISALDAMFQRRKPVKDMGRFFWLDLLQQPVPFWCSFRKTFITRFPPQSL